MSNWVTELSMNSKHSPEVLQHPVGLQALADGRGASITDLVPVETEGVQHPLNSYE